MRSKAGTSSFQSSYHGVACAPLTSAQHVMPGDHSLAMQQRPGLTSVAAPRSAGEEERAPAGLQRNTMCASYRTTRSSILQTV